MDIRKTGIIWKIKNGALKKFENALKHAENLKGGFKGPPQKMKKSFT